MKNIPIAKPYITDDEINAVVAVLKSGNLSLGPQYKEFEKRFAKHVGTKYACAVSSGTSGLHLALLAAGIKPGDEVITSPFSFIASSNSIMYVGAKPVFVDIDPSSYNINPELIEKKITKKTKAILPVHIFGQSADMKPILKLAKKYHLKIIEDACESLDAEYYGKKAGTFGESAVFAFYPNKQMTTGEGGMVVTNNKKVYELCCSLRNQGRGENMQWLDHKYLGYNYRMDEMSAALGLAQLNKLDFMISERQKIAELYNRYFKEYSEHVQVPETASGNTNTWFVYVIQIKNKKISRDRILEGLSLKGIGCKPYLPSIHLFEFYKKTFGYRRGDFPVSESVSSKSLALPIYIGLTETQVKYIVEQFMDILRIYDK
jgi:perosamine synthetase